jgi:small nuclear ribonucleoprotein (snRNP)-like protein
MEKKQGWDIIKKEDITENRRTIKCKWIFKIKRNRIFRARLMAVDIVEFLELTSMKVFLQ